MANVYDRIEESYDPDYKVIRESHSQALTFIQQHDVFQQDRQHQVIDLGVGHGTFLQLLADSFPAIQMTGVDTSAKMIELAKQSVRMTGIVEDIHKLERKLPANAYQLVIAHYILAYIPLEQFLSLAAKLVAPQAYLSLITSTHEDNKHENTVDDVTHKMASSNNLLVKLLAPVIPWISHKLNIPGGFEHLRQSFAEYGFELVERQTHTAEFIMRNPQEAYHLCIEKGWYVHWLENPVIPKFFLLALARKICEIYPAYPVEHRLNVENILLKKVS